ncbi:MAG: NmrA/HSCARG family protein [Ignavibacteriae bacterium]|nr:NmrA/HSCARG family protein [Ignavibacteriota bacterium]
MNKEGKTILVIGATGAQGGSALRHLKANGWNVKAFVRDPQKPTAKALVEQGIELVQGDMNDTASLQAAMKGVYGVFSIQQFWETGFDMEVQQGKNVANAAKAAGVKHLVYTSVDGAERKSGIPHFDTKGIIEEYIATLGIPTTVIRPVFFMENFTTWFRPQAGEDGSLSFMMGLPPGRTLQLIASDDIGAFVAIAFNNPEEYIGKSFAIAGDEITMPTASEILGAKLGKPVQFISLPIEALRAHSEEMAIMFDWFNNHGYIADIPVLKTLYPPLKSFAEWEGSAL